MVTLADVDAIETVLKRLHDCKLIVVDPVGSFLGGKTDAHRDNEVRSVLAPIALLAEKYGPAVLVLAHRRNPLVKVPMTPHLAAGPLRALPERFGTCRATPKTGPFGCCSRQKQLGPRR